MKHNFLALVTLCLLACDAAAQPAASDPSSQPTLDAPASTKGEPANADAPVAAAATSTPTPTPRVTTQPIVARANEETLLDRAGASLAASIGDGLGTANEFLARPASDLETAKPPSIPKTQPKSDPTKPPSGHACDVRTYAWGGMRITGSEDTGPVRLNKGTYASQEECWWAKMVGPQFADLDGDGREEAYVVIKEFQAAQSGSEAEGGCNKRLGGGDDELYVYEMDARCSLRKIFGPHFVGNCGPGDWCKTQALKIKGKEVLYGPQRYSWEGAKLVYRGKS